MNHAANDLSFRIFVDEMSVDVVTEIAAKSVFPQIYSRVADDLRRGRIHVRKIGAVYDLRVLTQLWCNPEGV
jgi:hypothetical protein